MRVTFQTLQDKARFLNPMKKFAPDVIPFEIRMDPLTGLTSRVFDFPFKAEKPDLSGIVQRSREIFCPFCPETLDESTPLFPRDLIQEGRIKVGMATLIPNLIPFDKYAGVAILSHQHYVPMDAFTAENMKDAFMASLAFIRRVEEADPSVQAFYINWNYMPPAGSSMVHPHLQPNCGEIPTNELRRQLGGSRRYARETGRHFWHDYMDEERKRGERYLGETGPTWWGMSYAPFSFLPDVTCIFPHHVSLARAGEAEIDSFLDGLSRVLRYFHEQDIYSFNLALFSVRQEESFRMNGRIGPRLFPRAIGNNDMAYLQTMHREPFTVRPPEKVCMELKTFF